MGRSVEQHLHAYAAAAVTQRESRRSGEYLITRAASAELEEIVRELRNCGPGGLEVLAGLFHHERIEVRGWAAAHALEVVPAEAEAVLEEIAGGPQSLEQVSAKLVLRQWRSGELAFP
jgi:hypothetical protein